MGLKLKNPLIISSSRLTGSYDTIMQCVDAGAGAIVLKSLFEEQIRLEAESKLRNTNDSEYYYWFPEAKDHVVGMSVEANLEKYLGFVNHLKQNIGIPVISSINCYSKEGWPNFAKAIQEAGADAIELNIAIFPFSEIQQCGEIETLYVDILKEVKKHVSIPVSVKLGYYFTNLCALAHNLVDAGADGLVLFNRYFRPDIDIHTMEIVADKYLSTPDELSIPMRWIALMTGNKLNCDLAASTGVHSYEGVVKQILVGAKAVQLCSTLLINGIDVITEIEKDLKRWMEHHHFNSLDDFRGKSLEKQTTDASFERIQYMKRNFE
jgi:dihydroorotate dehydrogenase (fumarate)